MANKKKKLPKLERHRVTEPTPPAASELDAESIFDEPLVAGQEAPAPAAKAKPASKSKSKAASKSKSKAASKSKSKAASKSKFKAAEPEPKATEPETPEPLAPEVSEPASDAAYAKQLEQASERHERALELVEVHTKWAAAGGIVPIPFVDIAAIAGVQLKLLAELSALYEVEFSEQRARALLLSLLGSVAPHALGLAVGSAFKSLPVVGTLVGLASTAAVAGTATAVVGELFVDHLELGHGLDDIDERVMKAHFRTEYQRRQQQAKASARAG